MYYNISANIVNTYYDYDGATLHISPDICNITISAPVLVLNFNKYAYYVGYKLNFLHNYNNSGNALTISLPPITSLVYDGTLYVGTVTAVPSINSIDNIEIISYNNSSYFIINKNYSALSGTHAIYKHITIERYTIQDNAMELSFDIIPESIVLPNVNEGTTINIRHLRALSQTSTLQVRNSALRVCVYSEPFLYEMIDRGDGIISCTLNINFTSVNYIYYGIQSSSLLVWCINNITVDIFAFSIEVTETENYFVYANYGQLIFKARQQQWHWDTLILLRTI
jgi:hypothetical protein